MKKKKIKWQPSLLFSGGMLGTWLRIKYPSAVQGAVAGSAPVAAFMGQRPPYDPLSFAEAVTRDASAAGGATNACAATVRRVWPALFAHGTSSEGRRLLADQFRLCKPLNSSVAALSLAYWLQSSFDYMAMGSYPFPSSYMLNGDGTLPAYPLRVACAKIVAGAPSSASPAQLFAAMREGVAVFYNASGSATTRTCFDIDVVGNNETTLDGRLWDYLACGQLAMPFARDGVRAGGGGGVGVMVVVW